MVIGGANGLGKGKNMDDKNKIMFLIILGLGIMYREEFDDEDILVRTLNSYLNKLGFKSLDELDNIFPDFESMADFQAKLNSQLERERKH